MRTRSWLLSASRFVAEAHDDDGTPAVHDAALVEFLASAWNEWEASGLAEDPGAGPRRSVRVPAEKLGARREPVAGARPGYFAYDTMTLIGPGTWEAARAAVDVALTAVDLVSRATHHAYALCRPPGHHAAAPRTAARAT